VKALKSELIKSNWKKSVIEGLILHLLFLNYHSKRTYKL